MTVETTTGAVSHIDVNWHSIDWQAAHQHVHRLQARIVKATQAGEWGKVQSLQHLLTHSFYAKAIAVKRVTENRGKKTAGIDGELWETPEEKAEAIQKVNSHGYQPKPLRRVYIDKANGKKRPLGIPTMTDRAMQALWLLALDPVAEVGADPNSYGFRKERSCADAIGQCFTALGGKHCAQWVLEADIKSCFDEISHEWLLENIPMNKTILQKWLKAGFMQDSRLYPTDNGTPQGGIISPVLANMTLDGLEKVLRERFPKSTRSGKQAKINLVRYADDFVITGCSKELLENDVVPLVEAFLAERGLQLSKEKTKITHIDTGFDFLGQTVRKFNGKLIIKPSDRSIKRILERVRTVLNENKQAPAGQIIQILNPILRGWGMYHRHVVSKQVYNQVDKAVFDAIWRWAKRRHSNKGKRWIKQKYFKSEGLRNWVFYGEFNGLERTLFSLVQIAITRHVKTQANANPYDPNWEVYFEQRTSKKMLTSLKGRGQLRRLWIEQKGYCPICSERITEETGWENHHITKKTLGGSDKDHNRVLLHPNCHMLVHSQSLTVEKPRPQKERAFVKA